MATTYIFRFADGTKDTFLVAPFTANGFEAPDNATFMPQAIAADTDLKIYGQGLPDYGEGIEQNLIYVLENFANTTSPQNPIEGQHWFNNATKEMFVFDGSVWGATILASGVSPMAADLNMGVGSPPANRIINLADPTDPQDAVTLSYADTNYFNSTGDTITGDLTVTGDVIVGGDVLLTIASPITGNAAISKDYADGTYLALAGGTMTGTIILTAGAPGNVLGAISEQYADSRYINTAGDTMTGVLVLNADPLNPLESATKQYVDTTVAGAADNVLTGISFISTPTGSPPNPINAGGNTMVFERSGGLPDLEVFGLDYIGKLKPASEITLTATGGPDVTATDVQSGFIQVDNSKLSIFGGNMVGVLDMTSQTIDNVATPTTADQAANKSYVDAALTPSVIRDVFLTDGISTLYGNPIHIAGDNHLSVYVNGQKKYADTYGFTEFLYARTVLTIDPDTPTNIDTTVTDYNFDIQIDGIAGSPVYNIALPTSGGSPNLTTGVDSHGEMIATINALIGLLGATLDPTMTILSFNTSERITSLLQGAPSDVIVSSSGSGTYLFDIPAGIPITTVNTAVGSPLTSSIEVAGDQTASFPIGKAFTILDTATNIAGESFDQVNVVVSSIFDGGSPGITTIVVFDNISPLGTITSNGNVYLTHIGALSSITTRAGGDYDYSEVDDAGVDVLKDEATTQIKFKSILPASEQVEMLLG